MFLTKMKKCEIESSITMLLIRRRNLITKEKAKEASGGKLKNDEGWKNEEVSVNDDLEMFLANLLNSKKNKGGRGCQFLHAKTDERRTEAC